MLMPDHQDSNAAFKTPIYDRVRKHLKREDSSSSRRRRSEAGVFDQEVGYPLELGEEAPGDGCPSLLGIEVQGVCNVLLSPRM